MIGLGSAKNEEHSCICKGKPGTIRYLHNGGVVVTIYVKDLNEY